MKIKVEQEFDCNLEMLLRAREERYKHLDKFPELQKVTIVAEEEDENTLRQVRHISIAESMPAVLATVMPEGSQVLIETSEFTRQDHVHTFEVKPGGGLDIFHITGLSKYYALPDGRAARNYDIEIKSKAFLIGGVIEGAIGDIYKKNLEKDKTSIGNFIKMLQESDATTSSSPAGDPQAG